MKTSRLMSLAVLAALSCMCSAFTQAPAGPSMTVSPDHADGIYATGDTVHWTVTWTQAAVPGGATYTLKSGGMKTIGTGQLKFEEKVAHFDSTFDGPNTLLVSVTAGSGGRAALGGAVADPFKIKPADEEPADFDTFWAGKLAELRKVSPNAQLTPGDSGRPGVTYAKLTLDNVGGKHVQGQIARPERGEKFPAILIPQWAGVYALQKGWATDRAKEGWLALNIEAHDVPIDNPHQFYNDLYGNDGALHNYWKIGNESRDTSYYVQMYLSACQAVEYLKTRPDWDGKTVVVMGTSQGGQQALVVAGLYPGTVTAALPFLPAACDNLAPSIGRASGFPNWFAQTDSGRDADKVHETSKYFDPVYFARRIKCPVLTGCGLIDDLAPPSSVLAAANQITAPKEVVILPKAGHQDEHGSQAAYSSKLYGEWLPKLVRGEMPATSR